MEQEMQQALKQTTIAAQRADIRRLPSIRFAEEHCYMSESGDRVEVTTVGCATLRECLAKALKNIAAVQNITKK